MRKTLSIYEAKARFSEIIRQVREGAAVTISYHGRPVAEIRPVADARTVTTAGRLKELVDRGVLSPATGRRVALRPVAKRRGALRRFLDDRE
jgi:prevent-host-death family protein